jgi:hypothetical protein
MVWFKSFLYQAASLEDGAADGHECRVSLWELFPLVGFIVTNLTATSRFYNQRGTAEQRQAGGQDDATELPLLPRQRGAAVAERHRLHPRQPLAARVLPTRMATGR